MHGHGNGHRHDHHHDHHDAHHEGHRHVHDDRGVSGYGLAPAGHNAAARVAQWQAPHHGDTPPPDMEPDFDLVEASFAENFPNASDPTSFLRLARVPFVGRHVDGRTLRLLRVEYEQFTDVGALTPALGGETPRHDPLPAALVSTRRRLRFAYFDGEGVVRLSLAETRGLAEILDRTGVPGLAVP